MILADRPNHQGPNELDNGMRIQMFKLFKIDKSKAFLIRITNCTKTEESRMG